MFTGFASENTPAIQVWEFSNTGTGTNRIALADDCAPIQFFRTGGSSTSMLVYLPSAPIEGKQIQIINARYGGNDQKITIHSSDVSGSGTLNAIATLAAGQFLVFCYSKQFISFGSSTGSSATGWITLNQSPTSAGNNYALAIGGNNNSAYGANSFIGGGTGHITNGNSAFVAGGSSNSASESNSFVGGGSGNIASGSRSFVGGGASNGASGTNAFASGASNTASGNQSFVAGGSHTASATYSVVIGGALSTANAEVATVIGGYNGTTRSIIGNTVFPANGIPIVSAVGVTQSALLLLGRQTTDATATVLRSNTSAASTTNQVILPNNSAYVFQGTCIANVTGGSTTSGWKYEGVIKRGANAASTALVAAVTPTVIAQDLAAATWVLAITADTTNGGIAVTVTGAAATTIRWVSRIETTEVTF